jgi:hypothetical protein
MVKVLVLTATRAARVAGCLIRTQQLEGIDFVGICERPVSIRHSFQVPRHKPIHSKASKGTLVWLKLLHTTALSILIHVISKHRSVSGKAFKEGDSYKVITHSQDEGQFIIHFSVNLRVF